MLVKPQIQKEQYRFFFPFCGTRDHLFTLKRLMDGPDVLPVYMCFVDLEKTYDCDPHWLLLRVL